MEGLIRWNRLTPSDAVGANVDETVAAVRERLRALGDSQYQAPILVLFPDGRIAPTAAPMLRKLAQEKGATILKDRLKDLIDLLCPEPWSVESRGPDCREAVEAAGRRRLPVIVTEGGRRVGLMLPPSHRFIEVGYSKEVFDLFDEPFPRSLLDQTEIVLATLNTTVAKVALDLKAKRELERAYLVVEMDDGSFDVMSSQDLNHDVERFGADVWSSPLRTFASRLRTAEAREYETVGCKQAQNLANQRGFLVLTDQGKPVGLLLSQIVRRTADLEGQSYDIAEGLSDNLFNAPQQMLQDVPPEVKPEKEPRFVNLWFEDREQRPVDRTQALILGRIYHLALNVGQLLAQSIVDWKRIPGGPQAIVEPQEKDACLYVSVFSQDFDIPEPTRAFRLPKEGSTDTVHIQVEPLRHSHGTDLARLEVCLYYRAYLVQTFEVRIEVVAAGESARNFQPQVAELTHARTASFPEMETLLPRELSLTITHDGPDGYRFTFLVDPDLSDEAAANRAIKLSCRVRLTRDDLTHLITKARRQLYNVVQTFDLLQAGDQAAYSKAIRALAQVGRQLYLKLFESSSAQALRDWMEASLPDGSTIQVVDLAGDFVFPWSLVYTDQPWDDDRPVDVEKFWGWRYELVILTNTLLDTYRQARTTIATDDPLRISVGMYERLLGTDKQKAFFTALESQTSQRVVPEIVTNRRDMGQVLTAADRDLYYFFCHGYTERIAADIQLDADLVSHFAQLAAANLATPSQSIREHLDDLFDVSDSWLRLTRGKLPLAMLKEMVPDRFSKHPVVFLNVCESAQVLPSLSDGFVPFFIRRGARAVLGTECSMNTVFADEFARNFLTCFFAGKAAGEILLGLRRYYLKQGNPLALAYTLYGEADLQLRERVLPKSSGDVLSPCEEIFETTKKLKGENRMSEEARWSAVDVLWDDDVDGLLLTLAARAKAEEEGIAQEELQMWDPPEDPFAVDVEAGPEWTAKMKALGQKWWDKLEPKLYDLLCDKKNPEHDKFMNALGQGAKMLAVALAPVLVAQVAALPAVAIVIATIAAKKIYDAGLEAACGMWRESMDKQAGGGQG